MASKAKYKPRSDGRFETKVGTGRYKADGRPERISIYADSSKELEEKVGELKYLIKHGKYVIPDNITVGDYCDTWFNTFKANKGINTKAMYRNIIDKHIKPAIGLLQLKDLKYADCQVMINERFSHYETCNKIKLTMTQIQKHATKDKIITDDFWDNIELPGKPCSTKRALTDLEKTAITKAKFTLQDKAFVYILYGCGLRREEALALRADDFDLKSRTVQIRRKVVFDKNTPVLEDGTKTVNGMRTLTIPVSVFPIIKFYVMHKLPDSFLFTAIRSGGLITHSGYVKMWKRIIKEMNAAVATNEDPEPIQGLTAHLFRHNYATMLYYSGMREINAVRLMGHKDGKMIREVYAHLDESKENTVERLDSAVAL